MSRRVKQVIYGILYLAIVGIIVTGIYFLFLKPAPSCFDGVQNEGEQGVDCGGPCSTACSQSTAQPISVLGTVRVFSPVAGHATVLAEIENSNSDLAAYSFNYTVTLYGSNGTSSVAAFTGTAFAYAAETKYLILPNEPVSAAVSRADIAISDIQWIPAAQLGLTPQFAFTNITSAANANGSVAVSGNVTDRDVSSFHNVTILAIFRNAAGTPIGASQTELDSLTSNATQNFSISYPSLPNENISKTEFHAYAERN